MILNYQTKFGCKQTSSLGDIKALAVTLTMKMVNQFFCLTHRLMIIHHQTKFEKKKGEAVQEIMSRHDQTHRENIWTNIH